MIVSIPDLCTLTYLEINTKMHLCQKKNAKNSLGNVTHIENIISGVGVENNELYYFFLFIIGTMRVTGKKVQKQFDFTMTNWDGQCCRRKVLFQNIYRTSFINPQW